MNASVRSLQKHERETCTECGRTIRLMVWLRGSDKLCHRCIEAYDRRTQDRHARGAAGSGTGATPRHRRLPPIGTRFSREWKGVRYEAVVVENGIEHDGRVYPSLTALADAIVGKHVSGPAWFGAPQPAEGGAQ
jgi:hypothetical protein